MNVLRPYGMVIDGKLELGLELAFESAWTIRPHTGIPEPFVLSSPFFNAHSHFEYRGLMGTLTNLPYWPWIRELTRLKRFQSAESVALDCHRAAEENLATGAVTVWEHSDRHGSFEAMRSVGLSGRVYLELITFFESSEPELKRQAVLDRMGLATSGIDFGIAPHATYTVDESTLRWAGTLNLPTSIHLAETSAERDFFERGEGPIADFYRQHSVPFEVRECSPTHFLAQCGVLGPNTQLVHCCDVNDGDIETIARAGCSVAHCPRSNLSLGCPVAPVRRMLEGGIAVRLGLDSAASSGPIDMFAEMRTCLESSIGIGEPLTPEQVWKCATAAHPGSVEFGGFALAIDVPGAFNTEELLMQASPEKCHLIWLKP